MNYVHSSYEFHAKIIADMFESIVPKEKNILICNKILVKSVAKGDIDNMITPV